MRRTRFGRLLALQLTAIVAVTLALAFAPSIAQIPPGCYADPFTGALVCDEGGGGEATAVPPATSPPSNPTPQPQPTPAPDDDGGSQPQPTPGGSIQPLPTPGGGGGGGGNPTPTPGTERPPWFEGCYSCVPTGSCPSGYYTLCYVTANDYTWVVPLGCNAREECVAAPVEPGPGSGECIPGDVSIGGGSASFQPLTFDRCTGLDWGYQLSVWARVPPHRVQVDPFPRWLVAMGAPLPAPYESGQAGRLTLQDYPALTNASTPANCGPAYNDGGCWSNSANIPNPIRRNAEGEAEPRPGDVKDYRLGLRWRRIDIVSGNDLGPIPPICWAFDERDWNIGRDYGYGPISNVACGTAVEHIYETSSWDKPHNGANFYPPEEVCGAQEHCCEQVPSQWTNPAYQVTVPTYWAAEWAKEWYVWEQVGAEFGECGCYGAPPGPFEPNQPCTAPPGICTQPGEWYGRIGRPRYDWVHHEEAWHTIDLRRFGGDNWYFTSWSVVTTGRGDWCAYEYTNGGGTSVPVPVIEIQSVLRDPCVLNGTCPEGYP